LRPRGKVECYGGNAVCKSEGAIVTCYLEGDEGDLKLTPLPGGGLKAGDVEDRTGRQRF